MVRIYNMFQIKSIACFSFHNLDDEDRYIEMRIISFGKVNIIAKLKMQNKNNSGVTKGEQPEMIQSN